jgi:hypothetical protein
MHSFMHDLSPEALALAKRSERNQQGTATTQPWPLAKWPNVRGPM